MVQNFDLTDKQQKIIYENVRLCKYCIYTVFTMLSITFLYSKYY